MRERYHCNDLPRTDPDVTAPRIQKLLCELPSRKSIDINNRKTFSERVICRRTEISHVTEKVRCSVWCSWCRQVLNFLTSMKISPMFSKELYLLWHVEWNSPLRCLAIPSPSFRVQTPKKVLYKTWGVCSHIAISQYLNIIVLSYQSPCILNLFNIQYH